jgi:hypothetical protein
MNDDWYGYPERVWVAKLDDSTGRCRFVCCGRVINDTEYLGHGKR